MEVYHLRLTGSWRERFEKMTAGGRDRLYAQPLEKVPPFEFNEAVSGVFGDMIRRSVPGYEAVVRMTGALVAEVCEASELPERNSQGVIYDLGCSLGDASEWVLAATPRHRNDVILIDASQSMMERCRERFKHQPRAKCLCADLTRIGFEPAIACIMNYTLQFIAESERTSLLQRLWRALLPGGVLILSEKVRLQPQEKDTQTILRHHAFKRLMGYSDREIAQKCQALEDVLIPDQLDCLMDRLQGVGFARIHVWFKCLNWVSLAAYKDVPRTHA